MEKRELFSIADTPFRGLRSDAHPLALVPGEAFDAINVRAEPGSPIRVRNGIAPELDTNGLPANAVFHGASPLVKVQEGLWLLYIAAEDPSDGMVHVYNRAYSSLTGWGGQWHELTSASGPFGDTRMAKPAQGYLALTPVDSDPEVRAHLNYLGSTDSLGPAVVVQNGSDLPRRVVGFPDPSVTDFRFLPITPIEAPSHARSMTVEAGVLDSLPVSSGAVTTAATPGGTFTAATGGHVLQTGSTGAYAWEWKSGTTVTPGDTAEFVMDSDDMDVYANGKSAPQIGLVVDAEDASWWDCTKLWAHVSVDGGAYAWELVHDPGGTKNNRAHVPTNVDETVVSAYSMARRTSDLVSDVKVNGLRIEVASDRLTPATKFVVRWVYASGWVPGTAQYAVARQAALNEAESGGVILASGTFGLETTAMRGEWESYNAPPSIDRANARFVSPVARGGGSLPADFVFPIDPRLFYLYRVPVVNPTLTELSTCFADTWSVYRKDPGDSEFLLVTDLQVGEWDGAAWTLSNAAGEGGLFYLDDTVSPEERDDRRRAPDAFNRVTPIGKCAVYANKRLYVGEALIDASGTNVVTNIVRISEEGSPGRFRSQVRFDGLAELDPSSGYEARLGVEDVQALVAVDGTGTGSSVHCLTDRSLYAIDRSTSGGRLFNVRRVAPFGTQSPHAATVYAGGLLWLDSDRALRDSRNLHDLSYGLVQGRLDSATNSDKAIACVFRSRAYVARETEDGVRVLVYNLQSRAWESDDALPANKGVAQFLDWHIEGASRMLCFASDCRCYEYERPGTTDDDGDPVPFAVQGRAFHNAMFLPVSAQRVGIVASTAPALLTTMRLFNEPAATVTGEIDLDTGGSLAWKYDTLPGGGVPGGQGQSVGVRIEGEFEDAFELLALAVEVQDVELGGARV